VLFPLQLATNFFGNLSIKMAALFEGAGGLNFLSPVKAIIEPATEYLKQNLLELLQDERITAWIMVIMGLLLLFIALKFIVDALKSLVIDKAKAWFDMYLFRNTYRAFLMGVFLTVLVQSSSITTSLVVPMAGAGLLTLTQIFPYTLGSNLGTTITAILAALVTGNLTAVTVAFSHLLFNVAGIIVWLPLKRVPIFLATTIAEYSTKSKLIPILYLIIIFFVIPIIFVYLFS
jgi:sodium-dependent phosphate cotransporter